MDHEVGVTLHCEPDRHCPGFRAAVHPWRHRAGSAPLGWRLHRTSGCHGRCAEAYGKAPPAETARDCAQHRVPSGADHPSNPLGVTLASRAARTASECHHRQLRRWMFIELAVGQQALGRLQCVWRHLFDDMQKRRPLQDLQRMQHSRARYRLEKQRNLVVLQQSGAEVITRPSRSDAASLGASRLQVTSTCDTSRRHAISRSPFRPVLH